MVNKHHQYEKEAVKLYRTANTAILSTLSKKFGDYPFGSFVTFVSNTDRTVLLYTSDLAEHTKNLKSNPKACLTLNRPGDSMDKQDSPRLTLIGDLSAIEKTEKNTCADRFFKFLPESKKYANMHDFNFYKLNIHRVRWIGGFGKIAWLNPEYWKYVEPKWKKGEQAIIDHMNEDHLNSICSTLSAQHDIEDKNAKMLSLNMDGYYVKSDKKIYFIEFDHPCLTMQEYKKMLVKQANDYREFEL